MNPIAKLLHAVIEVRQQIVDGKQLDTNDLSNLEDALILADSIRKRVDFRQLHREADHAR